MKVSFAPALRAILTLAVFAAFLPLSVFSQDEIEKAAKINRADLNKAYAERAMKMKPDQAAKLRSIQSDVAKMSGATFTVGATEALERTSEQLAGATFGDYSPAELQEQDTKMKDAMKSMRSSMKMPESGSSGMFGSAPSSYNFQGTSVKNQGGCGSCWAFTVAAAWEHSYKKFYGGTDKDMSEQELLACGKNKAQQDAGSCAGGDPSRAMEHIVFNGGAPTEADYPYAPAPLTANTCQNKPSSYFAHSYQLFKDPTPELVKAKIVEYGAVVASMKSNVASFQAYTGGVYNGYPNNPLANPYHDHVVVITGYNDAGGYWIVKNSWGTGWGLAGYAYIKYGQLNMNKFIWVILPKQ